MNIINTIGVTAILLFVSLNFCLQILLAIKTLYVISMKSATTQKVINIDSILSKTPNKLITLSAMKNGWDNVGNKSSPKVPNVIRDIRFNGEACAISTASTSIMLKNIIGKNIVDAKKYIENFMNMVNEQEYDENLLEEGVAFSEIYKQENRKNCVTLPYVNIMKILDSYLK